MKNDEVETTVYGPSVSARAAELLWRYDRDLLRDQLHEIDNADLLRHLLDLALAELSDVSAALLDASEEDEPEA